MTDWQPVSRRRFLSMSARSALLVPAGGSLALLLQGCGNGDQATATGENATAGAASGGEQAPETISQSYSTPFGFLLSFMESYVAAEEGFWEDEGLEIEIQGGQGTASAVQSILGGSTDYSRAGAITSTKAIANEGVPMIHIGQVYQRVQFELATLGLEALSPSDLAGKTIGIVSAGGQTEDLLNLLLASEGIDPQQVERPVVGVGAAALELAKGGEIDGWIALIDDLSVFREAGEEIASINIDDIAFVPADAYLTSRQVTQEQPDAVRRFLAGTLRAMEFIREESNLDRVVAAAKVYNPDLDEEQAAIVIPVLGELYGAEDESRMLELLPERWQEGVDNMVTAGLIEQGVELDALIEPSFMDEVKAG